MANGPSIVSAPVVLFATMMVFAGSACYGDEEAKFFFNPEQRAFADAVAAGNEGQLEKLTSNGADVNSKGKAGMTYVYWAIWKRSKRGLTYLLAHGADPNVVMDSKRLPIVPLPEVLEGTSPVSLAAKLEDPWYLKALTEHGADINLRNPVSGHIPVWEALASGRHDNVRHLISLGADLNVVDANGFTVLAAAIGNQKFDLAYELLIGGADPKVTIARNGTTILTLLRHVPIPDQPQLGWREKVIAQLGQQGLDVTNGR
jgi:ankyrin repeat protein